MKDSKLKTAGMRKLHWGKAVVSIVVTLAAMPLTHSLARVLKREPQEWSSSIPEWEWGLSDYSW